MEDVSDFFFLADFVVWTASSACDGIGASGCGLDFGASLSEPDDDDTSVRYVRTYECCTEETLPVPVVTYTKFRKQGEDLVDEG